MKTKCKKTGQFFGKGKNPARLFGKGKKWQILLFCWIDLGLNLGFPGNSDGSGDLLF